MLHAVLCVSADRARTRHPSRRRGRGGPSGRRRGDDAGQRPGARPASGRQGPRLHLPPRPAAGFGKVRYANQPIAVVIAETLEAATEGARLLRPRYETETPRIGLGRGDALRAARRRRRPTRRTRSTATSRPASRPPAGGSRRPTRPRRSTTTPWSPMRRWSLPGTATGSRSHTPSQGMAMAQGRASPACSGFRRSNIHIREPVPRRRFRLEGPDLGPADARPAWRRASSAGRSSWCSRASRCTARSAIARRDPPEFSARHRRGRQADRLGPRTR